MVFVAYYVAACCTYIVCCMSIVCCILHVVAHALQQRFAYRARVSGAHERGHHAEAAWLSVGREGSCEAVSTRRSRTIAHSTGAVNRTTGVLTRWRHRSSSRSAATVSASTPAASRTPSYAPCAASRGSTPVNPQSRAGHCGPSRSGVPPTTGNAKHGPTAAPTARQRQTALRRSGSRLRLALLCLSR